MKTRVERVCEEKEKLRKEMILIPFQIAFLISSLLVYALGLALWAKVLNKTAYSSLISGILEINIMTVGFFMILGFANLKFLIVLVKSLLKIMFMVWIVMIVQLSPMKPVEQSTWIISSAFFFIYLEVLLEINDCLFQVKDDFKMLKIKFLTATFIKKNSLSISILFLSIINIALSYFIVDLLSVIYN